MIDFINDNRYDHILTIEDPIEFVHEQEVPGQPARGAPRYPRLQRGLRSALREDPDIILVGEMRDLETIRLALTAAETGHLVFGTLHTTSAAKTIDRVIDVFPGRGKDMVRSMLSESLQAVISQTLLKRVNGGRVAAHEIMIGTPAIRNLIREDKVAQMYSAIQTGGLARHDDPRSVPAGSGRQAHHHPGRRPGEGQDAREVLTSNRTGSPAGAAMEFDKLLKLVVEKGASDLFITAGKPPMLKINGKLYGAAGTENDLSPEQARDMVLSGDEPGPADGVREGTRVQLRHQHRRSRALPGQRVLPAQPGGHGAAAHRGEHSPHLRSAAAAHHRRPGHDQARLIIFVGATGTGKSTSLAP
jgi:Tfp pilus assembly pilus retraction ATPase PilT